MAWDTVHCENMNHTIPMQCNAFNSSAINIGLVFGCVCGAWVCGAWVCGAWVCGAWVCGAWVRGCVVRGCVVPMHSATDWRSRILVQLINLC